MRVVILNAGKSTRLDGKDKLFVIAGGQPVHRWHERAFDGHDVAVVTTSEHAEKTAERLTWVDRVVTHDEQDGPVGALAAYLRVYPNDREVIVAYSDTLIAQQHLPRWDWVGVAPLCDRTWDHFIEGRGWVKEIPTLKVGVGVYAFVNIPRLIDCIEQLGTAYDQHLPALLNQYGGGVGLPERDIKGWHDAGDWSAIDRVPSFEESVD